MLTRRAWLSGAAGLTLAAGTPLGKAAGHPEVRTTAGPVRGFMDQGVSVFRGLRYGADTGPFRFRPSRAPESWQAVREAFEYGAACPQASQPDDRAQSEDCLFLNVWTPACDQGRRPVMVYIHGGAYMNGSGSSPLYDGSALCRRGDVVVVTLNHRLNAFGYLSLDGLAAGEFADAGNVGQFDLVLALRWVQDNIAAFGGDPGQVLAFGQSGGGAKIATLMAMPMADGLFHSVATMSGQQVTASGPGNARARTQALLAALDLAPDDFEALLRLPAERLVEGLAANDPVLPYGNVYFGPVLDLRSLPRHPFYPDAPPRSASRPMLLGNTLDETRAFLRGPEFQDLHWDDLPALFATQLRVDIPGHHVVDEYRRLYPQMTPTQVLFAATTASRSWRGAVVEAEARARQAGARTWVYQLNFRNEVEPEMGAPHGLDIPLVFGNLAAQGSITGTSASAQKLSGQMADAFIALARRGDPNHAGLPDWPQFSLADRPTMLFDAETRLDYDPRGAERRLFEMVPWIQPGS